MKPEILQLSPILIPEIRERLEELFVGLTTQGKTGAKA